jgi:hypothetical protein
MTNPASVLQVGGFRPTFDPAASNFGMSALGLPGEGWPMWDSKALLFVCQLNLTTAPAVPPLLADIKLITFFVKTEFGELSEESGRDWRLRAYKSLEGLARISAPAGAPKVRKGFECCWEQREGRPNVVRTKIGGRATIIQSEPWWGYKAHPAEPKYCVQINSEEKPGLIWGDGGAIYLARGTAGGSEDRWFLDWQSF